MKYNYPPLQEPCKTLIATGKCLGCNKLENINFKSDRNCKYAKSIVEESRRTIREILGTQERIKA